MSDYILSATLISIHAPHARSDTTCTCQRTDTSDFNPRSSCEERREWRQEHGHSRHFNPRSSCEERHDRQDDGEGNVPHFNPRSSCEERRLERSRLIEAGRISIHAPHARSDICILPGLPSSCHFNPRSSCEERQGCSPVRGRKPVISIHAPHARSDQSVAARLGTCTAFQSTLLMRGATATR